MELTQDTIKNLATYCVTKYAAESIPLNTSIVKVASDNELNPDQIKRVVEATNQLAYLSKLASESDRTAEFPLAEYPKVMEDLYSDIKSFSKQASILDTVSNVFKAPIVKEASDSTMLSKEELNKSLYKVASISRRRLNDLSLYKQDVMVKIANAVETVHKDANALEKIATLDNARELTLLVYGHDKVAETRSIFSDKDMKDVKSLSETLSMAKSAAAEFAELEGKVLKAEAIIKEAFIGPMIGAAKNISKPIINKVKTKTKGPISTASNVVSSLETADNVKTTSTKRKHTSDVWSSLRG